VEEEMVKVSGCVAQPTEVADAVRTVENVNEHGGPVGVSEIVWMPLYAGTLESTIVTLELRVKLVGQAIPLAAVTVATPPVTVMLEIGTDPPVPAVIEDGDEGDTLNEVAPG
jgi:hypothetical protein